MAPVQALLLAALALATAVGVGVGVGIGAAIWEGDSSPAGAESWLFATTARSGLITATGNDTLTILLRDAAPQTLGFTDRPARQARVGLTPDLWAALYADGSAPPNGALAFERAGAAVLLPVEMLNVTGAAPNYTIAARALGEGGVAHLGAALEQRPATVVRGAGDPMWAELRTGLEVDTPSVFIECVPPSTACFLVAALKYISAHASPLLPPPLGAAPQRVSRPRGVLCLVRFLVTAPICIAAHASPFLPPPLAPARRRVAACEPAAPRAVPRAPPRHRS
jgi:hypothetical protein